MSGHAEPQLARLQRPIRGHRQREAALAILAGVDGIERTPEEAAALALAVGLGYKWAAVYRHSADGSGARLLAQWDGGRFGKPERRTLAGTPYEALAAGDGRAFFASGVCERFPDDSELVERGAQAYQGRLVYDPSTHEVVGHVCAFDDAVDSGAADDLVDIVARWTGLEFGRARAAHALRESEERFALAMEGAGEHLWDWTAGSETLVVDPRILSRMGRPATPPEINRHTLLDAIHPEDRPAYAGAFQAHLRGDAPQFEAEFRLRMADGDYRWHRCRGVALRDDGGQVYRVAGSTADIGVRKAVEHALRESEERYALAMAGASEHLWDWRVDSDEFFVDPRILRLVGLPDEPPTANRADAMGLVHADDRPALSATFADHFRGKTSQIHVEFRLAIAETGEYRWHRARGLALRDESGWAYRVAGSAADITAERESQEALRQSEARYRSVFELGPMGMALFDLDRRYIAANDQVCRMLGYTEDELLGRRFDDFTHPDDRAANVDVAERVGRGELTEFRYTKRYIRKDGKIVYGEVVGSPVLTPDGKPMYALAIIQDITEQVEASRALNEKDERLAALQDELEQVARASAMGEMASSIAHEVNQPLAAVMNYIQAARELHRPRAGEAPDIVTELLDKATDQADRAAIIIRGLRSFFVRGELDRSEEDINKLVEDAVNLALGQGHGGDVELDLSLAEGLAPVPVDRVQIQQVVLNLVRNAAEAMDGAPVRRLSVCTRAAADGVEIEVADTGSGIPSDICERLFEPFVTTKPGGMGMGLSIAHSIVSAHGGILKADAVPEGGTVFRFTIHREVDRA